MSNIMSWPHFADQKVVVVPAGLGARDRSPSLWPIRPRGFTPKPASLSSVSRSRGTITLSLRDGCMRHRQLDTKRKHKTIGKIAGLSLARAQVHKVGPKKCWLKADTCRVSDTACVV